MTKDSTISSDTTKTYKVFISYCWSSPKHEKWVYALAERLVHDGVDVKFDKWDLKEGQDKYAFMESMIKDEDIDKVLIICDENYKIKADERKGGVGTECQIITSELYEEAEQTKFIPIIAQKGEQFNSYVPIFIKSRIGVDMSDDGCYEDGYEQLLRAIYERPRHRKPKLGKAPSYLFEDEIDTYTTSSLVLAIKNKVNKNHRAVKVLVKEYFKEFLLLIEDFFISNEEICDKSEPLEDKIYNKIEDSLKLRNDYIAFLQALCQENEDIEIDEIVNFFIDLYVYYQYKGKEVRIAQQLDVLRFIMLELFLYTIAIFIENSNYNDLRVLLHCKYFVEESYRGNYTYKIFNLRSEALDILINQKQLSNKLSVTADMIVKRAQFNKKSYRNAIIDADLLLYYVSALKFRDGYNQWFPYTYVYIEDYITQYQMLFLRKMESKRHCEKIKSIFNVEDVESLKKLFSNFNVEQNRDFRYMHCFEHVPSLFQHIEVEKIASYI